MVNLDSRMLTIRMDAKEYAALTGHSENYILGIGLKGNGNEIQLRISTADLLNAIHDIQWTDEKERKQ